MDNETVLVKQFNHQVSGRAKIVSLSLGEVNQDIGKPLNKTELDFYETVPTLLQGFIPCYKGTISITKDGITKFTPCDKLMRIRKPSGEGKKSDDYIVLEDITSSFNKPTIIDLKMGTRQYSDSMSSDKIARKKQRSLDTTSNDLGLRIAGIRSYCKRTKRYRYMDKMAGRQLNKDNVGDAFQLFLSDGVSIRRETVPHFLAKIQTLIELVPKLKLRLYCCSLLLLYEAAPENFSKPKIDVRIIDFAEFQRCTQDGKEYSGPDRGFLLGLNSLVDQLKCFLADDAPSLLLETEMSKGCCDHSDSDEFKDCCSEQSRNSSRMSSDQSRNSSRNSSDQSRNSSRMSSDQLDTVEQNTDQTGE